MLKYLTVVHHKSFSNRKRKRNFVRRVASGISFAHCLSACGAWERDFHLKTSLNYPRSFIPFINCYTGNFCELSQLLIVCQKNITATDTRRRQLQGIHSFEISVFGTNQRSYFSSFYINWINRYMKVTYKTEKISRVREPYRSSASRKYIKGAVSRKTFLYSVIFSQLLYILLCIIMKHLGASAHISVKIRDWPGLLSGIKNCYNHFLACSQFDILLHYNMCTVIMTSYCFQHTAASYLSVRFYFTIFHRSRARHSCIRAEIKISNQPLT